MGSPVSGEVLGECNAITSPGFGPSGLTLYAPWKPRLAQSALQGLLLSRDCGRHGDRRWYSQEGGHALIANWLSDQPTVRADVRSTRFR